MSKQETVSTNIRDVPKPVYDAIADEARRQIRSINAQLVFILREWVEHQSDQGAS